MIAKRTPSVFDDSPVSLSISSNYVTALLACIRKHAISILLMHNETFVGTVYMNKDVKTMFVLIEDISGGLKPSLDLAATLMTFLVVDLSFPIDDA